MLIRSAGISSNKESEAVARMKKLCEANFEMLHKPSINGTTRRVTQIEPQLQNFSCSSIFDFTNWICNECVATLAYHDNLDELQINSLARRVVLTLSAIDQLGDDCALVDYCHQVIEVKHVDVLATIAEILWRKFDSLMSMTAGTTLPRLLLDQYCLWRGTSPPSRLVVDPLLTVFRLLHTKGRIVEYLEHEVVLWNQNLTITASSPLSDLQVETPLSGASLLEDLENLIASNAVMHEGCVKLLFGTLTTHWDVQDFAHGDEIGIAILLSHFQKICNKELAREWLTNMLLTQSLWNAARNIHTLMRIGCFTITTFGAAASDVYKITIIQDPARAVNLAMVSLRAMTTIIGQSSTNEVRYSPF